MDITNLIISDIQSNLDKAQILLCTFHRKAVNCVVDCVLKTKLLGLKIMFALDPFSLHLKLRSKCRQGQHFAISMGFS